MRKKNKKGKLISIILVALVCITNMLPSITANAASNKAPYISGSNTLWVDGCAGEESTVDAVKWRYSSTEGKYYLFLPTSADLSNLVIWHTFGSNPWVNGKELVNGQATDAFSNTGEYTMYVGNSRYKVVVMKAKSTAAVFLNTKSNSMSSINSSKSNYESGKVLVTAANGSVDVSTCDFSKLKGRGNSTWDYEKKPYNLTLDKKSKVLGMSSSKKWCLLADYRDQSLLRNKVTYDLAHEIGMSYSPNTKHVDLYINGSYYGLYELSEKVEVGKNNLVKIDDLEGNTEDVNAKNVDLDRYGKGGENNCIAGTYKYYNIPNNPEDITGGYLLEYEVCARYASEASGFVSKRNQPVIISSPEYASKAQSKYISNFYQEFEDAAASSSGYNSLGKHYSEYIDVESFARMYLIQELSKNLDAAITSFYIYKESNVTGDGKMHAAPVWDFDVAYGNFNDGKRDCSSSSGLWVRNGKLLDGNYNLSSNDTVFARLFSQSDFEEAVIKEWNTNFYSKAKILLNGTSSETERLMSIDQYKDSIYSSASMNFKRYKILGSTTTGVVTGGTYSGNISQLKNYISNRLSYLNGKYKDTNTRTTVYFDNSVAKWASVNAYVWTEGSVDPVCIPMTKVNNEDNIYKVEVSGRYSDIIFKDTAGLTSWNIQTLNLSVPVGSTYNCYRPLGTGTKPKGQWVEYKEVKDLSISVMALDKASPQRLGSTITCTTNVSNAEGTCTYEYKINGEKVTSNNNVLTWTPNESGSYKISVKVTDSLGRSVSKEIDYLIKDVSDNIVTIYYKSNSSNAYIHYRVGTGAWTTPPGIIMNETNEISGYTHKYEIDLGANDDATVCFNNGTGSWDNNRNKNYKFEAGTYTVNNGVVTEIAPMKMLVSKFEASEVSPQIVNSKINLTATTSNSTASKTYTFIAKVNDKEEVIYSGSENTVKWIPTEAGEYTLTVNVKDANGKTATKSIDYKVLDELSISKFTADKTKLATDETVKLTAIAKDGMGEYKYKFVLADGTVLQEGTSNTCEFTPTTAGYYLILVYVTDNTSVEKRSDVELTVYDKLSIDSFKSTNTEEIKKGDKINFLISTKGGNGDESYTVTLDNKVIYEGKDKEFSYETEKSGELEFKLVAKDKAGMSATSTTVVKVESEFKIKDLSTSLESPQKVGTIINVKGECEGYKAPYSYNITITDENGNVVLNEDSNEIKWAPTEKGSYIIKFTGTNAIGETLSKESKFVIKDFKINKFDVDVESPQKRGTSININGEATGDGAPFTYNIVVVNEDGKEEVISNSNNGTWTPTKEGKYIIKFIANNSEGDKVVEEKEYEIKGFDVTSFESNLQSPQNLGKTIKFTGNVEGYGYEYLYNISVLDSNNNVVFTSDNNEVQWTPSLAGKYIVRFTVDNNEGEKITKDITYVINEKPKNVTTIYYKGSCAGYIHYKIGNGTWTSAPGEKMIETTELSGFTHKITIDLGSETQLTACFNNGSGKWDNNNSKNYTFGVGTYTLTNKVITEITPVGMTLDSFTTDVVSPQLTNTKINLNTVVKNAVGNVVYKYSVIKDGVEREIYNGSENNVTWVPEESGQYTLKVEVIDEDGTNVKSEMNYEIKKPLSIDSFTTDKNNVKAGNTVTLTAATSNGIGDVKYKFYLSDNTVLYEGSNNSVSFTPDVANKYKVYVEATDDTDNVVSSTLELIINEPDFAIKSFELSKTSPQQLGAIVTINALAIGGGSPYGYKIEVIDEDGKVVFTSNENKVDWKADKAGKYTIKLTVTNSLGEELTSEKEFVVNEVSKTTTTIYYAATTQQYIHYRIGNGAWTSAPGVAMKKSTEKPGYYEITIDLGSETELTACFNNGNGKWDNNNSKNYTFGTGKYICENKTIKKVVEDGENYAKIYYTGCSNAYIYYKVGNGTWTTLPGVKMDNSSSDNGQYEFTIDLGTEPTATVCFNDGNNTWDNNNNNNYIFTAGTYSVINGKVSKLG